MSSKEELEQMLLFARALGQGVSFLMTRLLIEHVRAQGNATEASMINTRAMLDWTLTSFHGNIPAQDVSNLEIDDEIRGRISLILDAIEREARKALNLAPPVKERH
jgi:hypothetical protein